MLKTIFLGSGDTKTDIYNENSKRIFLNLPNTFFIL